MSNIWQRLVCLCASLMGSEIRLGKGVVKCCFGASQTCGDVPNSLAKYFVTTMMPVKDSQETTNQR